MDPERTVQTERFYFSLEIKRYVNAYEIMFFAITVNSDMQNFPMKPLSLFYSTDSLLLLQISSSVVWQTRDLHL